MISHSFIKYFWFTLIIFYCVTCNPRISNEIQPPLKIYTFEGSQFRLRDVLKKSDYSINSMVLTMKEEQKSFVVKILNNQRDTVIYYAYFIGDYNLWLDRTDTSGFSIMTIEQDSKFYIAESRNGTRELAKIKQHLDLLEEKFIQPLRRKLNTVVDYKVELLEQTPNGSIFSICKDSIACDTLRVRPPR